MTTATSLPREHRWRCSLCPQIGQWGTETEALAGFQQHYAAKHNQTTK